VKELHFLAYPLKLLSNLTASNIEESQFFCISKQNLEVITILVKKSMYHFVHYLKILLRLCYRIPTFFEYETVEKE